MSKFKSYRVWDSSIRWFHWLNVLCILGLVAIGVVILNAKVLGVSTDGKILLKTVHVWVGYLFALNVFWRFIYAFIGGPYAKWSAILPFGRGYSTDLKGFIADKKTGVSRQYIGHNPVGRLAVTLILLLLFSQAVTGLVLAGTDIFYPPIGAWIANWIAAAGVDPATLMPYAKESYDALAYEEMRSFRKPFITVHYYGFYILIGLIALHIIAVVISDVKEGSNLISAMFSGKKILSDEPVDSPK